MNTEDDSNDPMPSGHVSDEHVERFADEAERDGLAVSEVIRQPFRHHLEAS